MMRKVCADANGDAQPRKVLVISGVNMTEGGILSVLRNVVEAAERILDPSWKIVVLAHRRDLLTTTRAETREYPDIKASWLRRMWFELITSRKLAREVSANVWLALHDITPLVDVERQFVYCHNPTVFTKPTLRALYFDWIFVAHSLMYGLLYSLNIRRNKEVFVQQAWIRDEFIKRFRARRVIVSRPAFQCAAGAPMVARVTAGPLKKWIYPTFPRHFKNIELLGRALEILEREGDWAGEISVTITGNEGRYAKWLHRRFSRLRSLKFVGRKTASEMNALYADADGLIFPSKLETWGLPITEAQTHGLPILAADTRYAHETVGTYNAVTFFDPADAQGLAELLKELSTSSLRLGASKAIERDDVKGLVGWDALVREVCY